MPNVYNMVSVACCFFCAALGVVVGSCHEDCMEIDAMVGRAISKSGGDCKRSSDTHGKYYLWTLHTNGGQPTPVDGQVTMFKHDICVEVCDSKTGGTSFREMSPHGDSQDIGKVDRCLCIKAKPTPTKPRP
jgi:hypothetical protein